jgi:uncharacterized membrane protein YfcA
LAVFVAATVSSTVGFAFSAIAAAILLQITSDQIAVIEIMLISSIALQTYCVALLWREIEPGRVGWFLLGGVVTIPIGVYALLTLNTPSYAVFIGLFLALYGVITLYRPVLSIARGAGLPTLWSGLPVALSALSSLSRAQSWQFGVACAAGTRQPSAACISPIFSSCKS